MCGRAQRLRRVAPEAVLAQVQFQERVPPASKGVLEEGDALQFSRLAVEIGLRPRHLISTIYPKELGTRALEDLFVTQHPEIHYSIYSVSDRFRRRWLPKAQPAEVALDRLVSWQRNTLKLVVLHHAYIAGENDAEGDVHAICDALEERKLMVHINVVRYNPFDPARHGTEPSDAVVERNAEIYRSRLPNARVVVIPRVGFDVAASCGMFFGPDGANAPPIDTKPG